MAAGWHGCAVLKFCGDGELADIAGVRLGYIADVRLEGVETLDVHELEKRLGLEDRCIGDPDTYPPHSWDTNRISILANQSKGPDVLQIEEFHDRELHLCGEGVPWKRARC